MVVVILDIILIFKIEERSYSDSYIYFFSKFLFLVFIVSFKCKEGWEGEREFRMCVELVKL